MVKLEEKRRFPLFLRGAIYIKIAGKIVIPNGNRQPRSLLYWKLFEKSAIRALNWAPGWVILFCVNRDVQGVFVNCQTEIKCRSLQRFSLIVLMTWWQRTCQYSIEADLFADDAPCSFSFRKLYFAQSFADESWLLVLLLKILFFDETIENCKIWIREQYWRLQLEKLEGLGSFDFTSGFYRVNSWSPYQPTWILCWIFYF